MPIKVRMAATPGQSFRFGIERMGDAAQFNFDTGTFVTAPPVILDIPLVEDKTCPGRYTLNAPHQQAGQFNGGAVCAFWLFQSINGAYSMSYLQSGIVTLPFTLLGDVMLITITDPVTPF